MVLETEAAIRLALIVRAAGYELEATPRANGADLGAVRNGTIWATFHVDVDRAHPLFLRVGATVWGGARKDLGSSVAWDEAPGASLAAFAKDRLDLACRRGRAEDPQHCADCPDARHPR